MDADDVEERRPGLTLMPEHGVDVPVWHGPDSEESGNVSAAELAALGVSLPLVERLRAWAEGWDHDPVTGSPLGQFRPGSPLTVRLARHLQSELTGHRIHLHTGDGPRPVEEWAG
ncbi:hypothetical protein [Blastococcus sp. TF02A-35]|uniref:hypothetical protein n=1 Tax=Blastococcus sp. TF02A-35 TaxID=2559612 RepID=UPI001073F12D|nr:hypothetical protein [Blastococcus sp. TF02A_35]TFV52241.1 hypothetical protein E4P43_07275 [Blastococcus sp. TF02A_35]